MAVPVLRHDWVGHLREAALNLSSGRRLFPGGDGGVLIGRGQQAGEPTPYAGQGGKARIRVWGPSLQWGPHVPTMAMSAAGASCSPQEMSVSCRDTFNLGPLGTVKLLIPLISPRSQSLSVLWGRPGCGLADKGPGWTRPQEPVMGWLLSSSRWRQRDSSPRRCSEP